MQGKRILIFGWAGSIHIQRWARGLSERGYVVRVISHGFDPIKGVDTVNFPRNGKWTIIRYTAAAARAAREFKPDLMHVHYAGGCGLWATRAGIHPLVVSVWGSDITKLPASFIYRQIIKRTLRKADYVTATGRMLRDATVTLCPSVKNKIRTVSFGVDVPDSGTRALPEGPIRLCFLKSHKPVYAPDLLLKAMVKVRSEIPDITLSMAGLGPITDDLKHLARKLGLAEAVTFDGLIEHADVYSFLGKHHLLVMPSLREGFGVVALEAAACGRPTIATNVGGVPEVVCDGRTGMLVPVGDVNALAEAIIGLARDPDRIAAMGREAFEFAKANYTWEKSLDDMSALYEELIAGSGRYGPVIG